MNILILNRDFLHPADGWYQIEAKGDHPNARANLVQVIDDQSCATIVNRFNAEADKPGFPGMLIDHEHFKHDGEKETRAYGWLTRLENRTDGIYGQIPLTGTGKKAVDEGDYRFFSTEYDPKDLQVLNDTKPRKVRPLALDGLTLTNLNNNKGQKPITNRQEQFPPGSADADRLKQTESKKMKTVCTLVGLSADASEEAVHAAVTKIINDGRTASGQLTIVTNRATTAEAKIKTLEEEQVAIDLENYADRFKPESKEFLKSMLVTNRAEAIKFLEAQPVIPGSTAPARVHNRGAKGTAPVDQDSGNAAPDPDAEPLRSARNEEIQDYKVKNRCTHEVATNAIRNRKPELFGLPKRGE